MNLLSKFNSFFRKQANALLPVLFHEWEYRQGQRVDRKYSELIENYVSWVYACASRNAAAVAECPIRLYRKMGRTQTKATNYPTKAVTLNQYAAITRSAYVSRALDNLDEVEEIIEHPFLDLLRKVNPVNNEFDTKELLVLHQELTGNAYMYLIFGQIDQVEELWLLPPQMITIIPDKKNYYKEFVFAKDTQQMVSFKPEEIVHFKYPNPKNVLYGLSPLTAAASSVDLNNAMLIHENALFENRAVPEFIISYPAGTVIKEDTKRSIKEQFRVEFEGAKKAGKLAVLSGGATIEHLTMTPKELNYLESRKFNRDEIAAIFGVPKSKLETDDVNRANAEAGNYTYLKDTILPRLMRIQDKFNERILPLYDANLFIAFDNPVPEDKEFRLKERVANIQVGYSTVNEERSIDGIEPIDGGDELRKPVSFNNAFGDNNGSNNNGNNQRIIQSIITRTIEETLKKKERTKLNGSGNDLLNGKDFTNRLL